MSDISIFKPFLDIDKEPELSFIRRTKRSIGHYWNEYKWLLIIFLWVFTLVLGFIGFNNYYEYNNLQHQPLIEVAYDVLRLFVVEGSVPGNIPVELEIARFLAPMLIALAGLQAFTIIFSAQIYQIRLKFLKDHIIICGLGENGLVLAEEFYRRGKTVIAVESNPNHPGIDLIKIKVIIGDATDIKTLKMIRAHKAASVFTTTGDDGINVEIAVELYKLMNEHQKKLQKRVICYVNVIDLQLRKLLNQHSISTDKEDLFELRFFNQFEIGAKLVLRNDIIVKMIHEDFIHESESKTVSFRNFIIIGFGRMGQSILLELIKIFEYVGQKHLSFTILDIEAETRLKHFHQQHPLVSQLCMIRTVTVDVKSRDFLEDSLWNQDHPINSIFICLDANNIGVSIAISLVSHFKVSNIPIFVQIKEDKGLATVLSSNDIFQVTNRLIIPYGILRSICNPEIITNKTLEGIAASFHKDYITQRTILDETEDKNPLLVKWDRLIEERRETMRNKAEHLDYKLNSINYTVEFDYKPKNDRDLIEFDESEIEFLAKMEHSRWYADRVLNGWKYSSEKNPFVKTNPYLIPWSDLPEEIKEWNFDQIKRIPVILQNNNIKLIKQN